MEKKKKLTNWAKTMIVLCFLLLFMAFPVTRQLIIILLPLGSGIDDLIFFILLFLVVSILLIKTPTFDEIREWFHK